MGTRVIGRFVPLAFLLLIACLLPAPMAFADQVVYFVNGKAMMVKSVEKGEKFSILEMEGGGRIGVPTDQIERIEEYVVSAPTAPAVVAAPAPQPAPVAAAAGVAQPQAGTANIPVPVAPIPPGPGMGGKPLTPGGNLDRLNPLVIGGEGGPGPRPAGPRPGMRAGQARGGPGTGGPGGISGGAMSRPGPGAQGRRAAFGTRGAPPRPRPPLAAIPSSSPGQYPVVETKPDPDEDPPADDSPSENPPEEPEPEEEEQAAPEEGQSPAGPPSQ